MHRHTGLLVFAFAALTGLGSLLASKAPAAVAQAEPTCPSQSDQTSPISAKVGSMFAIGLASNPTTGYLWRMDTAPDSSIAQLVSAVYVAPAPPAGGLPLAGAGGRECWVFSAIGSGQTTITLDYLRPFDPPSTPPGQSDTFTVNVSGS